MDHIHQLIEIASRNPAARSTVVHQLIAIGVPAVPAILETIRTASTPSLVPFDEVILGINDPDLVPILIDVIHEQNPHLVMLAFKALSQFKGDQVRDAFLACVLDTDDIETRRALAAEALGNLGDLEVIPSLSTVSTSAVEQEMFRLALAAVVALAKLGNHDKGYIATSLITYQSDEDPDYDDSEIIRANAAAALHYVITPGMVESLRTALRDRSPEVRAQAVDAFFYLGTKDAIAELAVLVDDDNKDIQYAKRIRLEELTGYIFQDEHQRPDLQAWWINNEDNFLKNTCYFLGKPLWIPTMVDFLVQDRYGVLNMLHMITGMYFPQYFDRSPEDADELALLINQWFIKNDHKFAPGYLYRYGYKQDIESLSTRHS